MTAIPRVSADPGVRHARGAGPIGPIGPPHVKYYLFAPQGSGETESLTPLKLADHLPSQQITHLSGSTFGSKMGVFPSKAVFDSRCGSRSVAGRTEALWVGYGCEVALLGWLPVGGWLVGASGL